MSYYSHGNNSQGDDMGRGETSVAPSASIVFWVKGNPGYEFFDGYGMVQSNAKEVVCFDYKWNYWDERRK